MVTTVLEEALFANPLRRPNFYSSGLAKPAHRNHTLEDKQQSSIFVASRGVFILFMAAAPRERRRGCDPRSLLWTGLASWTDRSET